MAASHQGLALELIRRGDFTARAVAHRSGKRGDHNETHSCTDRRRVLALQARRSTGAQTKLTLGHNAAPAIPSTMAAVKFAELVKAKSGGRIEVQVAPAAQLGDDAAMLTALRTGAVDMSANSQGAISTVGARVRRVRHAVPVLRTCRQAWKVLDGPVGKELADKSRSQGHDRARLLGQRHPPHHQQQAPDHQAPTT